METSVIVTKAGKFHLFVYILSAKLSPVAADRHLPELAFHYVNTHHLIFNDSQSAEPFGVNMALKVVVSNICLSNPILFSIRTLLFP